MLSVNDVNPLPAGGVAVTRKLPGGRFATLQTPSASKNTRSPRVTGTYRPASHESSTVAAASVIADVRPALSPEAATSLSVVAAAAGEFVAVKAYPAGAVTRT